MVRYIAFLRAINVGGHTVKMDKLGGLFTELGFERVQTFIASGNVVFETSLVDELVLAKRIETRLREALGYEVATFLRTDREIVVIAAYDAFPAEAAPVEGAMNIGFLAQPLEPNALDALKALETDIDRFHVHGREIFWRCLVRQSQSRVSGAAIERAIKGQDHAAGCENRGAARGEVPDPRIVSRDPGGYFGPV